jgi:hypothetical protein
VDTLVVRLAEVPVPWQVTACPLASVGGDTVVQGLQRACKKPRPSGRSMLEVSQGARVESLADWRIVGQADLGFTGSEVG